MVLIHCFGQTLNDNLMKAKHLKHNAYYHEMVTYTLKFIF